MAWTACSRVAGESRPRAKCPPRLRKTGIDSVCIIMQHARLFMHKGERAAFPDMAAEIHQSVARRAAILRIIGESTVRNQDELVKVLRKQGFDATQSSVSRDLRELRVAKAGDHYILPAQDAGNADRSEERRVGK